MQENLKKKYGITDEELKRAVDQIPFGKIACEGITLVALIDLLASGDISAPTLAINHQKGEPTKFTPLTTDNTQTMREFIKEHLDEILDKFFKKNLFCCICDNKEKCENVWSRSTALAAEDLAECNVNANIARENGKKFLDSEATPENIAKLKEIYEELVF